VCWSPANHRLPAVASSYAYLVPAGPCLEAYLRVAVLSRPGVSVGGGIGGTVVGTGHTTRYLRMPAVGTLAVLVAGHPGRLRGLACWPGRVTGGSC
jgi:hypothetical protein